MAAAAMAARDDVDAARQRLRSLQMYEKLIAVLSYVTDSSNVITPSPKKIGMRMPCKYFLQLNKA
jgi:hypothetical protein